MVGLIAILAGTNVFLFGIMAFLSRIADTLELLAAGLEDKRTEEK